ncbi:hypothetical protein ACFL2O_10215 [Thermodesulfobacteriota bacterium]
MATIEQYKSGLAAKAAKQAVDMIQSTSGAVLDTAQGQIITKNVKSLEPLRLNEKQADDFILKSDKCAVGERLCECMYPDARHSEAIFLDELAEAMVGAGKATYISKDEAQSVIKRYPGFPIVISKVSGKYMEICRSWPKKCVYWNMEMHHTRCIKRVNRQ